MKERGHKSTHRKDEIEGKALELLCSPDLFGSFLKAIGRNGVVGEERNACVLLIAGVSRLLDRPLNVIVKARSSAGKNHLVNGVLRLFPEDAVRELTSSSTLAWNYSGDDFRHRIVYLQERNEASGAVHPARLLISEGRLVRSVTVNEGGVRRTKRFVAEGPIASISTTTKNQLEIDDETRHVSIWIDESPEQTKRIARACATETNPLSKEEISVWRQAHRLIQQYASKPISLPDWFENIANDVYVGDIRVRRYFPAFVTACRAMALLRSFQTGRLLDNKKVATLEVDFADFEMTAILFESVFVESLHRSRDQNLETRSVVERIARRKGHRPVGAVTLMKEMGISKDSAYARLRHAAEANLVRRVNKPTKGNRKLYLPSPQPRFIPDPEKVHQKVADQVGPVRFVHPLTGEWVYEPPDDLD